MALLTHVMDPADLAKLSPSQQVLAESHLEGLVTKHVTSSQSIAELGKDMKTFVAKLPKNP